MKREDKPLVWMSGEVKTPPLSQEARLEAGYLLRALQKGEKLALPHSRPMPSIGARCHELRIDDRDTTWRVIYRIDRDAIVILDVFQKKAQRIPKRVIEVCKRRILKYDSSAKGS
jgi:phage-related protein